MAAWGAWSVSDAEARGERARVEAVTRTLARSVEALLAADEVGDARRVLSEAAIEHGLETARLTLGDGAVIASRTAREITQVAVPERWPAIADAAGAADGMAASGGLSGGASGAASGGADDEMDGARARWWPGGEEIEVREVVRVPGRGEAVLTVATRPHVAGAGAHASARARDATLAGAATLAGGLGVVLLAQGRVWRRARVLWAIRGGLRDAGSGRDARGALDACEGLGVEARAWNQLMKEREAFRRRETLLEAAAAVSRGSGGASGESAGTLDALWHGIIVIDHGGRVRFANGAAAVLLGVAREQMAGADAATLAPAGALRDALAETVAGRRRQRQSIELEGASPGGDRTVLRASIKPLRQEDGAAAILVLEDVTQQRIADESRNALVAQATHELRTPLTNMRLYVEALIDDPDADAATRTRAINVISQEARRLERIVGDMLSVSEMEAGGLRLRNGDVRLDAVFEELREDFAAQAVDKEIELGFEMPPKFPVVQGDRDKLVLVLHNLVGNALKYTPTGGKVVVRAAEDGGRFRVDVVDNGIGIKAEEHELVFERFYRAKDARIGAITGSGLGLALARQVARMHGGDITVASQVDKGSTFTLVLPLGGVEAGGGASGAGGVGGASGARAAA